MVHMAAITSAADRERRAAAEVIEVNLAGLAIALTEAAKAGIDRFLYTGSIAVFGPRTEDGAPIEEDHPHDPASLYAITKSAGEAVVARLGGLMELDWAIGRLGRVFGPYEHDTGVRDTLSQIYQVTRAARQGRPVCFDRPCVKNWNYARDVAVDLALLLDAPYLRHRIYNLGAPYAWSLADWCARLAARPQGFSYRVGPGPGDRIDLLGDRDGGLLSWGLLEADFVRPPPHTLDQAFEDYMRFLDDAPGVRFG
jgi:UDP-glucuronate 4-epimerase